MVSYVVRFLGVSALLVAFVPHRVIAQGRPNPRWEIPGFDFRPDGVLRTRARAVRALRARLMASRQFDQLNAPLARMAPLSPGGAPQPSATAVTGVLEVPAILFRFKDSPAATFTAADYNAVLFAATPTGVATGRPYTYRSFYRELSDSVFDIQGAAYGYATLDSNEVYYNGGTSTTCAGQNFFGSSNCNGIFSGPAFSRMQTGLDSAIRRVDASIDFSQYVDPTTGFVPLVLFMDQAMGGECGPSSAPENHLWAHRSALSPYSTQDDWPGHPGQKVKISDYILQTGFGGVTGCTAGQIMGIGTVAHETGHGLGLPDLYDVTGATEGIGQWGLMSSGSFTTGLSPSRMEAWSLSELGWITIAPADTNGIYTFDAAPLSDTAFYVRPPNPNPRGEYFLIENRQRQQSDSAVIRIHCHRAGQPDSCPGGLLIWHVDSTKLVTSSNTTLQAGAIHGLALMQADAFRNLEAVPTSGNFCPSTSAFSGCSNRGDAGDLFPGPTVNTGFVYRTNPAAVKNVDGSFAGFGIDFIQQLVANRTMSFRLRHGSLTIVRGSDTAATIQFDAANYQVFRDLLDDGSSHTVGFADSQIASNGRTRWRFQSWSDGGAISHGITGSLGGDTLTANLLRDFKLVATTGGGGTITPDTTPINLTSGTFIREGRAVTLTATPDSGQTFGGWSGDTVTLNTVVVLPMGRPYSLVATFGTLAISSVSARPNGVMGAAYADTLRSSGGTGTNSWTVTSGALPLGLTLGGSTGIIAGFPRQTGDFTFTATVTSGAQNQAQMFTMSVTAPSLATADVTTQLLGPTAPLNADQVRYLDFLGNGNGVLDIGDFLAWVKATGAPLSAAMMQVLQRKGGPR